MSIVYSRLGPLLAGVVLASLASMPSQALTLEQALALAGREAPNLMARAAELEAARQAALPAGELPDPKLLLGLQNLPIEGQDRWRLDAEPMTMRMLGVMQEVPNRAKRSARVELAQAGIDSAAAQEQVERLQVQRQAAQAWIVAQALEQRLQLFQDFYAENRLLERAVQARLAGGRGRSADSLAPRQEALALAEREDELQQQRSQARAVLRRWVGAAADESLRGPLPDWPVDEARYRHALPQHPELQAFVPQTREAEARVKLAEADKRPDWSWELAYQQRDRAFGDMLSLQLSIDLPVFAGSRQNPRIAAQRAELLALEAERETLLREHATQLAMELAEHRRLQRAVERSREQLLPLAEQRVRLSLADYQAGRGELGELIAARRERVEAQLRHLDFLEQRALVAARLHFAYAGHQENDL
ncbi:TolC family protein [Pseudomonas sp. SP16.1]|uniref:TolC family protein n=1 Tax=Pseudomonas sp. SP16.1 TaxID=3458854 RepID=UPI004045DEC6